MVLAVGVDYCWFWDLAIKLELGFEVGIEVIEVHLKGGALSCHQVGPR